MTLWNPTIHPVTIHHRVPVTREYLIRDPTGNLVAAEVYNQRFIMKKNSQFFFFQYLPIPDTTKNIPGRMSTAQNQYIFQVSLPALGYSTYYFEAKSIADAKKINPRKVITTTNEACILQNEVGHDFQIFMLI